MAVKRDPRKLYPHDWLMARTIIPFVPSWVTPNMVTVLRFVLTPFVLLFLHLEWWQVAIPLFVCTAATDALDGSLARVRGKITAWGSLYDPLADKLLIGSTALLVVTKYISPRFALAILGLEVLIVIGGYWGKRKGRPVSANIFGKMKMLLQVIGVTLLMVSVATGSVGLYPWSVAALYLALVLAFVSFLTYGL